MLNRITPRDFERFMAKVRITPTCWIWAGNAQPNGYGQFWHAPRMWLAHRWSYSAFVGEIPDGLEIDHLCRTPLCVRPTHLDPVSGKTNTLRGKTLPAANVVKTHCPQGHPYDVVYRDGKRRCRVCRLRQTAASKLRKAMQEA